MRDGIVQRGKTWTYVVRERDPRTGTSKPRWVGGFATREAAKDARDAARHAVNRGTYVPPQSVTVGEYLDLWVDAHSVELKPSTAKTYRDNIARYLKPALGAAAVQSLTPSGLSVVFRELHECGGMDGSSLSPRTVEFARAVLRRALHDAVLDRIIEINPVIGTKLPARDKPKHTTWTADQLRAFLDSLTKDDRWATLWTLAAATGMRRGELMALRWADVDLEAQLIHVEHSVTQVRQERVYVSPKNHERRSLTIDLRTVAALRSWRLAQMGERLAQGSAYDGREDLVFRWEDGRPVLPDYATRTFGFLTDALDLPRLKFHELRHTHATLLLREGVPVHIVAKRLGHKDPSVTLDVYADAIPEDDHRAVETFATAVWEG